MQLKDLQINALINKIKDWQQMIVNDNYNIDGIIEDWSVQGYLSGGSPDPTYINTATMMRIAQTAATMNIEDLHEIQLVYLISTCEFLEYSAEEIGIDSPVTYATEDDIYVERKTIKISLFSEELYKPWVAISGCIPYLLQRCLNAKFYPNQINFLQGTTRIIRNQSSENIQMLFNWLRDKSISFAYQTGNMALQPNNNNQELALALSKMYGCHIKVDIPDPYAAVLGGQHMPVPGSAVLSPKSRLKPLNIKEG